MDQIINMVTIAFEGMVLFYFQKNKGKTERKSIILFAFLWLIMFFTEWKLNLEGYAEELFYLVITILAARTVFLKKPINATMYGVSFMAVRHLSYIIVYFLVICFAITCSFLLFLSILKCRSIISPAQTAAATCRIKKISVLNTSLIQPLIIARFSKQMHM